ncbi:MAG: hypothetical protein HY609_06675 [Deltaproteobacteria bacterium]|nr:hypothetical protein [Deltaproteobacteria bacterium]
MGETAKITYTIPCTCEASIHRTDLWAESETRAEVSIPKIRGESKAHLAARLEAAAKKLGLMRGGCHRRRCDANGAKEVKK